MGSCCRGRQTRRQSVPEDVGAWAAVELPLCLYPGRTAAVGMVESGDHTEQGNDWVAVDPNPSPVYDEEDHCFAHPIQRRGDDWRQHSPGLFKTRRV